MDNYDLRVDFMTMHDDGTIIARVSNLRDGLRVTAGDVITVGADDATAAQATVLSVDVNGTVVVKVLDEHASLAETA